MTLPRTPITMLERCTCGGFVPQRATACPHCGRSVATASRSRLPLKMLGGAIGGGVIAFTLMACYGRPPCPKDNPQCYGPPPAADDAAPRGPDGTTAPGTPLSTPDATPLPPQK